MVASVGVRVSQAIVLAAVAFPAAGLRAGQAVVLAAEDSNGGAVRASQAVVLAAVLGRTANPKVRAWGYAQDGHEFYVLRLGNIETLVCDITTGEWFTVGSGGGPIWRALTGTNWTGTGALPGAYGSNVLVGDDTTGTLYFLNPDGDFDDHPIDAGDDSRPFTRQLTAQHLVDAGYDSVPCYGVQAFGSAGDNAEGDVELEYSDDRGRSWISAGVITVAEGDYSARLHWQSLGLMDAPGRLFRFTDDGAIKRFDDFEIEVGE